MDIVQIWVSLILAVTVMGYLGYIAYRKTGDGVEEFVLQSRTLGLVAGFFTVTATLFSALSYFGIMGWYYSNGIGTWVLVADVAVLGLYIYIFGARIWYLSRKYGFLSLTDYMKDRYESAAVSSFASLILLTALTVYVGAQFRGAGITLQTLSNNQISFAAGAIFLAIIVASYTAAGGFRAVIWTDVFQGALMYTAIIVVTFFCVNMLGGFAATMKNVETTAPELLSLPGKYNRFPLPWVFSTITIFSLGNFVMPQMTQRIIAMKSRKSLKLLGVWIALGAVVIFGAAFYISMAARTCFPNLAEPEAAYPAMLTILPTWLAIFAMLGIICATLTTCDSIVLTISSMVFKDFYEAIILKNKAAPDKMLTKIIRFTVPSVVILALLVAWYGPASIIELLVDIVFPLTFLVTPIYVGGLFWKGGTRTGALSSMVTSVILLIVLKLLRINFMGIDAAVPTFLLGCIIFYVVSRFTKPVSKETIVRHFGDFEQRVKTIL